MEIVRDTSIQEFLKEAGPLLYQDEAVNNVMIGLCDMEAKAKVPPKVPRTLLRVLDGGETVSAVIQTHPPLSNLVLTYSNEDQLQRLAKYLKQQNIAFPGVVGPANEAEIFSDLWSKITGKDKKLAMGQKIYKAEETFPPKNVRGTLEIAGEKELSLVTQWLVDFSIESLPPNERYSFDETKAVAARKIADQWVYLWRVDGNFVSMANISRPTKNGIAVNGVFTPKQLRKNGYASAAVAGLTQAMLSSGKKFCVLYTDLANPTSNKIYQDVGYREVTDSKYFLFT